LKTDGAHEKNERRYEAPRLVRYGRVSEVTLTGRGSGKEAGDNRRPVTFSNT